MNQHGANGKVNLDSFLEINPEAAVSTEAEKLLVSYLWGSKALSVEIEDSDSELISILNSLRFPPRFSAIWHVDQKALEVIYAPLSPTDEERERAFTFYFNERTYQCEFRNASERLLSLAKAVHIEPEAGINDDRNLRLLRSNLRRRVTYRNTEDQTLHSMPAERVPTSFWLTGLEIWDENEAVAIATHLNFYMRYFDKESPTILIHEDLPAQTSKEKSERYPYSTFPETISARSLDPFLLSLWESTLRGAPRLRFLHTYQILEYATFYHASDSVRDAVRRAVMSPHTHLEPSNAVNQILEAVAADKQPEIHKMQALIDQSIEPKSVWREVQPHSGFFSEQIQFDGGVTLDPLVKEDWNEEDFAQAWHPKFIEHVRKIRNALVHGREQRQANVIAPTRANDDRLRPWLAPMSVVAEQVILCRPD